MQPGAEDNQNTRQQELFEWQGDSQVAKNAPTPVEAKPSAADLLGAEKPQSESPESVEVPAMAAALPESPATRSELLPWSAWADGLGESGAAWVRELRGQASEARTPRQAIDCIAQVLERELEELRSDWEALQEQLERLDSEADSGGANPPGSLSR